MWEADAILTVVAFFTLALSVVRGRALPFNHSISLADVGAVQALGKKVPELGEVLLRTRQTLGVQGASARRRHVRPRRAERTQQRVTRIGVFVLEGVLFHHDGIRRHQQQKHGHRAQLGEKGCS